MSLPQRHVKPQRTRISIATLIYNSKLFKLVYANHKLYTLHTINRKMCLQKVNVIRNYFFA